MPTKPTPQAFHFAAPRAAKFGVDRNAGVLTGVALITAGVEAKGHGIFIDEKTLSTAAAVLATKENRFKAAIKHLSWASYWEGSSDRVMEFPGWFSEVKVVGSQLVAGKLEFYDDFKTDQKRLFNRILEMAEKTPDLFGISLEPWGYLVYVGDDGVEYSERPKDVALKYDGLPALRVTDLTYGAIVDDPAANPGGFFAELSAKFPKSKLLAQLSRMFADEQSEAAAAARLAAGPNGAPGPLGAPPAAPAAPAAAAVVKPLPVIPAKHGDLGTNTGPAAAGNGTPLVNSPASSEASTLAMKEILQSIKAEFGADKAKFSQAMSIFGENPEITFEALKAKMVTLDLAAAAQQVTTLTSANQKLTTDLDAAEKARDEWKGKFETLKGSGASGEVPLGAPSSVTAENPWLPGQENLTRQAEITNTNPELAKTLKAAAQAAPAKKA